MEYETSPELPNVVRSFARVLLFVGAIGAVWLIAPAAANALEPSDSAIDAVTDAAADTDDVGVTDATTTVTEAAGDATGTVTGAAGDATGTVKDTADSAVSTTGNAAASVTASADDAVSTAGNTRAGAADVARRLQDAVSTVDIQDTTSAVEAKAEPVTSVVPTARRTHGDDGLPGPGEREDVTSLRFADEPTFTSTDPALTILGPMAAATTSGAGAATSSSGGARDTPATPDGVPPPAMGSTARDVVRGGSSFDDLAAILVAVMIALGLVRWSRRENETVYQPTFLSLAGRPG